MKKVSDLFICLSENILKSIYFICWFFASFSAAIMQRKCKNPYIVVLATGWIPEKLVGKEQMDVVCAQWILCSTLTCRFKVG